MGKINTVLGPIEAGELGRTLMHEHFLFGFCGFQGDITLGGFQEQEYLETNLEQIAIAQSYGIQTIVDATTNECGRNPAFYRKLAEQTGIHIICSTGYYFEPDSAYAYWKFRSAFGNIEDEIYQMMKTELTEGIAGTDICAGVIKLASSANEITPFEQIFFRAAARAQKDTGCTIITHTQLGTMGPQQARLLIEHGADPAKISIGHMCGSTDLAYHEELLRYGVYDSFDRFGLEGDLFHTPTDEERARTIASLVEKGYGDHIVLGHDSVSVDLGRPLHKSPAMKEAMKYANIGNIGHRIIPMFRSLGMTESDIEKLLTHNPAALLGA